MNGCGGNCKCGGKCKERASVPVKGGAVANRAAIFLRKARAVARKCAAAGVPSPFTVNARGRLTINPAVSEAQRRYLNAVMGHQWTKDHHFDNHGQLPEKVGAENERRMEAAGTCTANESSFFGRFWTWLTRNQRLTTNDPAVPMRTGVAQPALRQRDPAGRFGAGAAPPSSEEDREGDEVSRMAEERGWSEDEVRAHLDEPKPGGKKVTKNQRHLVANAHHDDEECPECGGKMEEDEDGDMRCKECGYVENSNPEGHNQYSSGGSGGNSGNFKKDKKGKTTGGLPVGDGSRVSAKEDMRNWLRSRKNVQNANPIGDQDDDADDRTGTPEGGDARPDGRHNKKLTRQKPIDVIDDDGDPYLDEDDHSDLARDDQIKATQNAWTDEARVAALEARRANGLVSRVHDEGGKHIGYRETSFHKKSGEHLHTFHDTKGNVLGGSRSKGALPSKSDVSEMFGGRRKSVLNAFPPKRYDGPDPHDATKQAAASTVMTEHDDAQKPAMAAVKQSSAGDSDEAADSHDDAAEAHEDAATQARTDGDHMGANDHDQAAAMHRKASSMHRKASSMHKASMTFNQTHDRPNRRTPRTKSRDTMTRNQWIKLFMNDPVLATNMPAGGAFSGAKGAGYSAAQAAAMAGKLEGSYGSSGGTKGTPGKGAVAKNLSEHAEKTKSKSAHQKAASAHKEAAKEHMEKSNEHEDAGDKKWAQHHEAMSSVHSTAARSHAAKAARMTRNEQIQEIIANCTCPETAHGLRQLITNEPDAIGQEGGEVYAGRQEGNDEPALGEDDDDDLPEKVKPKKNKMATNEYLSTLPAELRETLTEAAAITNRDKQRIVTRLTANIRNPTRREFRISELMGRSLKDLRGMLELVGNAQSAQEEQRPAGGDYLPLYGPGNVTFTDNADAGGDDVLDCPTLNFAPPARTA